VATTILRVCIILQSLFKPRNHPVASGDLSTAMQLNDRGLGEVVVSGSEVSLSLPDNG
jgi:hypothetical protein